MSVTASSEMTRMHEMSVQQGREMAELKAEVERLSDKEKAVWRTNQEQARHITELEEELQSEVDSRLQAWRENGELRRENERLRESNQNRLNIFRKFLRKTKQVRLDLLAQEAAAGRLREWQRKAFAAHPNIDMDIEFVEGKDENPR